jgi:hypothetical protein
MQPRQGLVLATVHQARVAALGLASTTCNRLLATNANQRTPAAAKGQRATHRAVRAKPAPLHRHKKKQPPGRPAQQNLYLDCQEGAFFK